MQEQTAREFARTLIERNTIDPDYYRKYDVKRGLRNADGTGVVAGITNISNVHGYMVSEGDKIPVEGKLTFRGHDVRKLIENTVSNGEFGYNKVAYLLIMGSLPTPEQEARFQRAIDDSRELPDGFTAEHIMKEPTRNIMNLLMRSIATLYAYDSDAESHDPIHEMQVAISLMSRLPRIMVLGYYALRSHFHGESMIIHRYVPGYSSAETILSMMNPTREFRHEDAVMLDIMMMLHAEHGGGNNSTFTLRSLTSSGTDAYSAYAGGVGSLKGARHGGANIKVIEMFEDIKQHVRDWGDDGQVVDYLRKIVNKEAFDQSGLVYGMGHAVYTLSDPRAEVCRFYARQLAAGTEFEDEFALLESIARLSPQVIGEGKKTGKIICPNIDMFSGLVYRMMGIPQELFTPLFACSRMAGWTAHRFEEMVSGGRIIRPAYKSISTEVEL